MITNEREAITNLQTYLRQLSYFDDGINAPPTDGIFDSETEKSVRDFQTKYGLSPSGVADKETWDLIYKAYLDSIKENSLPEKVNFFPVINNYELELNDSWFLVELLQYMLEELRYEYDNFGSLVRSGIYDSETESAVKDFQKRNMLEETGKVDKETWNAITRQFNHNSLNFKE